MPEVDLLACLRDWHRDNESLAAEHGVALTLGATPACRSKPAVWVTASRVDSEAQMIVWSTGGAEFAEGSPERAVANEHHEVGTAPELEVLLVRLLDHVGGA